MYQLLSPVTGFISVYMSHSRTLLSYFCALCVRTYVYMCALATISRYPIDPAGRLNDLARNNIYTHAQMGVNLGKICY